MSRGNMLLGYAKGKVGSMVFSRLRGEQIVRAYNASPANPRSQSQQLQRTKLANLVNFYRRGRLLLNHSFTNKKEKQSSYNAFVSRNINLSLIHLTKEQAIGGASIVAPYLISDGVLPPIQIDGGGVDATTNIQVGNFTIDDETTTVADFSRAVLNNNSSWQEGDQFTYVSVVQNGGVNGGQPFAVFNYFELDIDTSNTTLLRDVMPEYGLSIRNKAVSHGAFVADGGFAWIHSRKSSTGALQASRQSLILTSNSLYEQYATEAQTLDATRSYNAQNDNILVPDGSHGGDFGGVAPVIASLTINGKTISQNQRGIGISADAEGYLGVTLAGSYLNLADDANPADVLAMTFTKNDGTVITFVPDEIMEKSATSVNIDVKTPAAIATSDYGILYVKFTNEAGSYVEQTYSIAESSSGSGTGGNPL